MRRGETRIGTAAVLRGDALALPVACGSVDLIVTSPPYYALRSYRDAGEHYAGQIGDEPTPAEYVTHLIAATAEMVRTLKPNGSIFVNLGDKYVTRSAGLAAATGTIDHRQIGRAGARDDNPRRRPTYPVARDRRRPGALRDKSLMGIPWRYAIRCMDELGLILRAEILWDKPNGQPESQTDRVRRSHETWFHFVTQQRYYANVDPIRQQHVYAQAGRRNGPGARPFDSAGRAGADGSQHLDGNPSGRLPGSVWSISTTPLDVPDRISHELCCGGVKRLDCEGGVDHYGAFPMEWPRRFISAWAPPDGSVLDPFGGTGTTALVAKMLGRTGITVDRSADYCRVATWRTTDPSQMAAALQIEKPAPIHPDQPDLFGDLS